MTSVVVGKQVSIALGYLDQDKKPMQVAPTPDAPPVWTQTAPTVDQLTYSGETATAKAIAPGSDTIDATVSVGGKVFTAPPLPITVQAASPFKINITYDASAANAPSGFSSAVDWAVSYLESIITAPATVNINVGWGTVAGVAMGAGALGESQTTYTSQTYDGLRSALLAKNAPGSSTLPATAPLLGTLYMGTAGARALGLYSATGSDGSIGISSTAAWSFAPNVTPPAGSYYAIGTLLHELTEILGRVSLLNYAPNFYGTMDLFRWTAPGVRCTTFGGSGSTAYFSIDNGVTKLATWNNNPSNGDLGDWISGLPSDDNNDYGSPGVLNTFSQTDITNLQAMGF